MTVYTEIDQIPLFKYGLVFADPPWTFANWSGKGEEKNATAQYDCMTIDDIKAMQIGHIASKNCLLWLWATNPMLREAFDVLDAWDFKFKTAGHWSKKTVHNKQAFGTGYILRSAGEPFLIGTIGKPWTSNGVRSVIEGLVREHSRKPEEAFVAAEKLCGDVARLDLFSRQQRTGWDSFGAEVGKFASAC